MDKDWTMELGERVIDPHSQDELLKDRLSERKRKQIERQEELDEARHNAEMAAYEKKAKTSEVAVEKAEREPSEPPFKFEGKFNLGTFDFQKQQQDLQEEIKKMRDEEKEQSQYQGQANERLREEIHQKELALVELSLKAEIQRSNEKFDQLLQQLGSKKSFMEEYTEAMNVAKTLGAYNPQAGSDAKVEIELKKIEFENQMALRKMDREEKKANREFQLQLRKYDDDKEFKKLELDQKRKRDEMVASAPETIGRVLARGMFDSGEGQPAITGEKESAGRPRGRQPSILAGVGESGETECLQCQQPIAIGPTARQAVCANCGARYSIKRVPVEESTE